MGFNSGFKGLNIQNCSTVMRSHVFSMITWQ